MKTENRFKDEIALFSISDKNGYPVENNRTPTPTKYMYTTSDIRPVEVEQPTVNQNQQTVSFADHAVFLVDSILVPPNNSLGHQGTTSVIEVIIIFAHHHGSSC